MLVITDFLYLPYVYKLVICEISGKLVVVKTYLFILMANGPQYINNYNFVNAEKFWG